MSLDFSAILTDRYVDGMLWGALTTMELFVLAWIFAFLLAMLLVAAGSVAFAPLRWLVTAFIEYHRNVPILVQILVWYFAVPEALPGPITAWINARNSEFILALIALSLYSGVYMSEDMRSGMRSLPKQQVEAARALGLNFWQAMRDVLLPQAIRASAPALLNQTLVLFKSTSLAMAVGVAEMTYAVRVVENETYRTFEAFTIATVFYVVLSLVIMAVGVQAERRMIRS